MDSFRFFRTNLLPWCNLLQVASYQKQGFLLLPNLISPSLLKEVLWEVHTIVYSIDQNAATVSKWTKSWPIFEKNNCRKIFTFFHRLWEGERWVWSVVQKASSWWGQARSKVVFIQCNAYLIFVFFYTTAIRGQKLLHLKVHKFATKFVWRQNCV